MANLVAQRIALKTNHKQETYFRKACGISRFAYNWALARWKEEYAQGNRVSETSLRREFNAIKRVEYPWVMEVTKVAPQASIQNLGKAFDRFFKKKAQYPKFKKKGIHESFRADNGPQIKGSDAVKVEGKYMYLPRIGKIRLKERIKYEGQIKSVVVSKEADDWFVSITIRISRPRHVRKSHGTVGIDVGISRIVTLSNGTTYEGPKSYHRLLRKLRRASRMLSKKVKGSRNRAKARLRLAKLHQTIRNIRQDFLHKMTTSIVLNYTKIGIEDLNVAGMMKNRRLARHIMDQSFYELRRQLVYKSELYGATVYIADRFYPSSQLCSHCDTQNKDLPLKDRHWTCICGEYHDRDINAAKNLAKIAKGTVSSTGSRDNPKKLVEREALAC